MTAPTTGVRVTTPTLDFSVASTLGSNNLPTTVSMADGLNDGALHFLAIYVVLYVVLATLW